MSILSELFTLGRGKVNDAGQSIVDANAITILDEKIRESETEVRTANTNLAQVMATSKIESDKLSAMKDKQAQYTANIQKCLASNNEGLAREVAEKLGPLEADIATQEKLVTTLDTQVVSLKANIHKAEAALNQVKSQADVARATDSVNKARAATAASASGATSQIASASDSLARIQERQNRQAAQFDAADQLASENSGEDLDKRLAAAGITSGGSTSADDILARFKKAE